jgi:hypothetical protein
MEHKLNPEYSFKCGDCSFKQTTVSLEDFNYIVKMHYRKHEN